MEHDDLAAMERRVAALSPALRRALADEVRGELAKPFRPLPGPQMHAYLSKADQVLYGGQAGGGKSFLLLGIAANDHHRSLILRREGVELDGLVEDSRAMFSGRDDASFSASERAWRLSGGRTIRFGGCRERGDWRKYAGRARDFLGFDEAGEFLEEQVASLTAWLRSAEGRRCRVVFASNPPRSADGAWLAKWFAPWLDPAHAMYPAPAGELRWCVMAGGKTRWMDGPGETMIDGETYTHISRTFVPSSVDDNPYLAETDYRQRLQNLPGVLRDQLLKGDFLAGQEDDAWQVIPTAWVREAQTRWREDGFRGLRMTAVGVDVAQGGADATVIAPRYGTWFAPLVDKPGRETPDAPTVAGLVVAHRRDGAAVVIDVGGGYGGGPVAYLKDNDIAVAGFNGAGASSRSTADGQLRFVNKRAEAAWRFREALDPGQEGGSPVALPPDRALLADLTAPRWTMTPRGILVEAKEAIRKRLGRSPDRGDAVIMCWSEGEALAERRARAGGPKPLVLLGYVRAKRRERASP